MPIPAFADFSDSTYATQLQSAPIKIAMMSTNYLPSPSSLSSFLPRFLSPSLPLLLSSYLPLFLSSSPLFLSSSLPNIKRRKSLIERRYAPFTGDVLNNVSYPIGDENFYGWVHNYTDIVAAWVNASGLGNNFDMEIWNEYAFVFFLLFSFFLFSFCFLFVFFLFSFCFLFVFFFVFFFFFFLFSFCFLLFSFCFSFVFFCLLLLSFAFFCFLLLSFVFFCFLLFSFVFFVLIFMLLDIRGEVNGWMKTITTILLARLSTTTLTATPLANQFLVLKLSSLSLRIIFMLYVFSLIFLFIYYSFIHNLSRITWEQE
jgi:hypothetical protein